MLLSSLNEKPEGRLGPGRLAPSVTTAGLGSGDLALRAPPAGICLLSWAWALGGGPRPGAGRTLLGRVPGQGNPAGAWTSEGES